MNEVLQVIRSRRSVRNFTPEPVSRETIMQILDAARWAPSGKNTQPWRFVVVENAEKREALAQLVPQDGMVATASLTVAVLRDRQAGYDELKDVQGIGAAIENFLLAACALGLAACWMGKVRDRSIETLLEVKENEELMAIIPVGHPGENPQPAPREPLSSLMRFI